MYYITKHLACTKCLVFMRYTKILLKILILHTFIK